MHDLFEMGYVDKAIFQPTYLLDLFPNGFQHHEPRTPPWRRSTRTNSSSTAPSTRGGRGGYREFEETHEVRFQGCEALHRRVA